MNIIDNYSHFDKIDRVEINNGNIVLFITEKNGSLLKRFYRFKDETVLLDAEGI